MDSFDEFSSEEEQEMFNYVYSPMRRPRVVRPRPNHYEGWDDVDFRRRFRLRKDTVQFLLSLIIEKIKHNTERNQCVSPILQLLIALRFYATGSFHITVGDFSGLHKSTVCVIVQKVTAAIASLRSIFICLPRNEEERIETQEGFYNIARFPRVVAALDCTHVRIMSPGGDTAENFRNRKGYFSINVQAACKYNLKFQDIVARWPGSSHDSLIFANSATKYKFDNGFYGNGIILGDSGYFLNHYLLTPLNDPHTPTERLYNESQIRTRNAIERCFGVWKRRFPVVSIGMRCKLPLIQDTIVATAVLHNLAIDRNEEEPLIDPEVQVNPEPTFEETPATFYNEADRETTRQSLLAYFEGLL